MKRFPNRITVVRHTIVTDHGIDVKPTHGIKRSLVHITDPTSTITFSLSTMIIYSIIAFRFIFNACHAMARCKLAIMFITGVIKVIFLGSLTYQTFHHQSRYLLYYHILLSFSYFSSFEPIWFYESRHLPDG